MVPANFHVTGAGACCFIATFVDVFLSLVHV